MSDNELIEQQNPRFANRRRLLLAGGLAGAAATVLSACTPIAKADSKTALGGDDLLAKIVKDKKVRLGVDLTFQPLQFKDSSGKPTGYAVELTEMIFKDLNVKIEWVEMEFAQLFAGLVANKFDLAGIAATILPSRAAQVLFSSQPAFLESNVLLVRPGLTLKSEDDLNSPNMTIAVLSGSSQEAAVPLLYPKAKSKSLGNQEAIQDVASGRSDVTLLSEFNIADALKKFPKLTLFKSATSFADVNTYFVPQGQNSMKAFIDNSLLYYASHGTLKGLWNKWIGDQATSAGLPTVPVTLPYLAN
ncbi:MAG TPA: transporter substrate-binding domain-containing protein [Gryllotalpicola sp.]